MKGHFRDARPAVALTLLIFLGLTLALARPDERIVVRVTRYEATPLRPAIRPGTWERVFTVVGVVDGRSRVYRRVTSVELAAIRPLPPGEAARPSYIDIARTAFDPASGRFWASLGLSYPPEGDPNRWIVLEFYDLRRERHAIRLDDIPSGSAFTATLE
jgi:hypothetical protein